MTDEEQYRSTIYIANARGEIKGCGFIIGERHVMTCTHVVEFCRASEAAQSAGGNFHVVGQKDDARFRLKPVANARDMVDPDVAVLELDDNENFPGDHTIVRWEPCEAGLGYCGTGIIKAVDGLGTVHLQKVAIDGAVRNLERPTRHFVSAAQDDLKLDEGCSGGAVFNKAGNRDLIGMVSEYQQDLSGTIVRAQALRDCWPEMRRSADPANPFVDLAPTPAANRLLLADLDDSIARCNREAQTDRFRDHIRELGLDRTRRGALLTTIHGQPLDLPDRLSDRLSDLGPRALIRRKLPEAGKQPPRPCIDMAKCLAATEAATRARVEYRLQDTLQSDRSDIASFTKAIRKLGRPLVIEVRATEAFIAENGPMAAAVWTKIAAELSERDLGNPLFIFFIVLRSGDPAGVAAMVKWNAADPSFLVLDELAPIPVADVCSWAETCYDGDTAQRITELVAARTTNGEGIRLKQLQDWLTGA